MLSNATIQAAIDTAVRALHDAKQLAIVAGDWHLDEVEINGRMVDISELIEGFDAALAELQSAVQPANGKENVFGICRQFGGYAVIHTVAQWLTDELLPSPTIQMRQDVQEKVQACAQELRVSANKLLL